MAVAAGALEEAVACHLAGRFGEALRCLRSTDMGPLAQSVEAAVLAELGAIEPSSRALSRLADSADPRATGFAGWARGMRHLCRDEPSKARAELGRAAEAFREGKDQVARVAALLEAAAVPDGGAPAVLDDLRRVVGDPSLDGEPGEDLRWRWLELASADRRGPDDAVVEALERLASDARVHRVPRIEWRALALAARLRSASGLDASAHALGLAALEVLEAQALDLPADLRPGFWLHPERQRVRDARPLPRVAAPEPPPSFQRPSPWERTARLLEVLKALAAEHDLERLLAQVVDHAVELSGAERGLLILVDAEGRMQAAPRVVRSRGMRAGDASVPFSRSIAEAVLIDGAPIVTVDAAEDDRLAGYLSVHRLELRSVACLPIRSREGVEGVLYLEHRLRRGRFGADETSLLMAFSDQAAIALGNARLVAEIEQRRIELESKNREIGEAKARLEQALADRTAELHETRHELERTRGEGATGYERHGIVGQSAPMRRVADILDRVRDAHLPVVIVGESGTGKELVARAIHYAGARSAGPFVAINCAAVPEALLESELFGHVRGAFTGADRDRQGVFVRASGGTLLLDEVGDMSPAMQVKLLRVLQEGRVRPLGSGDDLEVDVRVVVATQRPLAELVAAGRFRDDLLYRLDVVQVRLPPLRERVEDIPILCEHFLARMAGGQGGPRRRLGPDALERLCRHPWPGNVRQLEHVLLHACILSDQPVLCARDLPFGEQEGEGMPEQGLEALPKAAPSSLQDFKVLEKQRMLEALERHGWNRARAAQALGMPRRTFYRRLREHAIQ
jgi:serine/threonine-protein kinase PknK